MPGDWIERAACAGWPNIEDFYPANGSISPEIRALCTGCPVRMDCLAHALDHGEYGTWGGVGEGERAQMIRRQQHLDRHKNRDRSKRRKPTNPRPSCGTSSGARSHRYYRETVCDACAEADREAKRQARKQRRETA
jgi:hypothetical protein